MLNVQETVDHHETTGLGQVIIQQLTGINIALATPQV